MITWLKVLMTIQMKQYNKCNSLTIHLAKNMRDTPVSAAVTVADFAYTPRRCITPELPLTSNNITLSH
jgi:hypothetical protein